ncbi:MAG: hypothetical protein J2P46_08110, partial [Zavarzinella sp.]|nr:hypothetical protein [Zavarzinella sp.]
MGDRDRAESFSLFRNGLKDVAVIAFGVLFRKVADLVAGPGNGFGSTHRTAATPRAARATEARTAGRTREPVRDPGEGTTVLVYPIGSYRSWRVPPRAEPAPEAGPAAGGRPVATLDPDARAALS